MDNIILFYRAGSGVQMKAGDPQASTLAPAHLESVHQVAMADTNRDGQLGLGGLLRVIELYNQRVATTNIRTGAYLPRGDTEDGFMPANP